MSLAGRWLWEAVCRGEVIPILPLAGQMLNIHIPLSHTSTTPCPFTTAWPYLPSTGLPCGKWSGYCTTQSIPTTTPYQSPPSRQRNSGGKNPKCSGPCRINTRTSPNCLRTVRSRYARLVRGILTQESMFNSLISQSPISCPPSHYRGHAINYIRPNTLHRPGFKPPFSESANRSAIRRPNCKLLKTNDLKRPKNCKVAKNGNKNCQKWQKMPLFAVSHTLLENRSQTSVPKCPVIASRCFLSPPKGCKRTHLPQRA